MQRTGKHFRAMGCSKKIHNPPTEEIFIIQRGGEGNSLKNVINLYRMFKEGKGVVNFPHGGGWIFSGTCGIVYTIILSTIYKFKLLKT